MVRVRKMTLRLRMKSYIGLLDDHNIPGHDEIDEGG